jgi:hypothetical protein
VLTSEAMNGRKPRKSKSRFKSMLSNCVCRARVNQLAVLNLKLNRGLKKRLQEIKHLNLLRTYLDLRYVRVKTYSLSLIITLTKINLKVRST